MSVVRASQVFPEVERVVYRLAPLAEVICQVRFPSDLRIGAEPPATFQQRIRQVFPVLTRQHVVHGLPDALAKAVESLIPPTGTTWQFATEDGAQLLQLTQETLTLVSRAYVRWEDFRAAYQAPLQALVDLYKPSFFTRIGLRYRDLIHRSKLGLEGVKWSDLLTPPVLGELMDETIEAIATEAHRNLVLSLPERGAKVHLQHGFAEIENTQERGYLIDCDFFVGRSEVSDGVATLEYLHQHAFRYFRWCITDRLHAALEPDRLSS
jgi:uncharacterized protein (TIGR04255 family)